MIFFRLQKGIPYMTAFLVFISSIIIACKPPKQHKFAQILHTRLEQSGHSVSVENEGENIFHFRLLKRRGSVFEGNTIQISGWRLVKDKTGPCWTVFDDKEQMVAFVYDMSQYADLVILAFPSNEN